nr:immunoglobulin light chain junction region [Macaca mulatta]
DYYCQVYDNTPNNIF